MKAELENTARTCIQDFVALRKAENELARAKRCVAARQADLKESEAKLLALVPSGSPEHINLVTCRTLVRVWKERGLVEIEAIED